MQSGHKRSLGNGFRQKLIRPLNKRKKITAPSCAIIFIKSNISVNDIFHPFLPSAFNAGFTVLDGVLAQVFQRKPAFFKGFSLPTVKAGVTLLAELSVR